MNILLLPCDTRPPTLELPHQLARVAGVTLLSPPLEHLNQLNQPGNTQKIREWLLEHAPKADALIVSLEMLCLGGLIPARRVSDSLEDALSRLEVLKELKALNPKLHILAHGVIVRVGSDDDPLEEKPYFGEWGARLRVVSEWTDRVDRERDGAGGQTKLKQAINAVPADILENWLGTRERNHRLHHATLELLKNGVLERLHLTLDDTTPYGLAALDRRRLEARIDALRLWNRAEIYPGADEVSACLLARAILRDERVQDRRVPVKVVYPSSLSQAATTLYEDRPLGELVSAHLRACGCEEVSSGQAFTLFVNAPATRQGQTQPDFETVDTSARFLPGFAGQISESLERGENTALADVAYPNGAEVRLMKLLENAPLHTLLAYAAWNTAGNTLGSAIATAVCGLEGRNARARAEALFSRLTDDWIYQSEVRLQVWNALERPSIFDLGDLLARAESEIELRIKPIALELWTKHFAPYYPNLKLEWNGSSLAWPRLFTGVFPLEVKDD